MHSVGAWTGLRAALKAAPPERRRALSTAFWILFTHLVEACEDRHHASVVARVRAGLQRKVDALKAEIQRHLNGDGVATREISSLKAALQAFAADRDAAARLRSQLEETLLQQADGYEREIASLEIRASDAEAKVLEEAGSHSASRARVRRQSVELEQVQKEMSRFRRSSETQKNAYTSEAEKRKELEDQLAKTRSRLEATTARLVDARNAKIAAETSLREERAARVQAEEARDEHRDSVENLRSLAEAGLDVDDGGGDDVDEFSPYERPAVTEDGMALQGAERPFVRRAERQPFAMLLRAA